jgi:hypothetical protein
MHEEPARAANDAADDDVVDYAVARSSCLGSSVSASRAAMRLQPHDRTARSDVLDHREEESRKAGRRLHWGRPREQFRLA